MVDARRVEGTQAAFRIAHAELAEAFGIALPSAAAMALRAPAAPPLSLSDSVSDEPTMV